MRVSHLPRVATIFLSARLVHTVKYCRIRQQRPRLSQKGAFPQDSREGFGTDIGSLLLTGIVGMLGQEPAWAYLPLGSWIKHAQRGMGTIIQKVPEVGSPEGVVVTFGEGDTHTYRGDSVRKMKFSVEMALEGAKAANVKSIMRENKGTRTAAEMTLLGKALMLTVLWDQADLASSILNLFPPEKTLKK